MDDRELLELDDRELLELSAKAAAIGGGWGDKIEYHNGAVDLRDVWILEGDDFVQWNPLTDDGDALRLAVRLRLMLDTDYNYCAAVGSAWLSEILEPHNGDPCASTRRAIVRAAAAIALRQRSGGPCYV